MRCVSVKLVPCLLTAEQEDDRVSICSDLREWAQNDPKFMSSVITGDESWVYEYDLETRQISSRWKTPSSPQPKKERQVKSNFKTMLFVFFEIDGLVRHEYIPRGQRVNKEFCNTVLQCPRDLCADIALRCGAPAIGSCTMTMLLLTGLSPQMNFWRNIAFCRSHTVRTLLTLLHATSCSRKWGKQWKVADSMMLRDSSQCDETNDGNYKKWLPEVLSSVAGTLERVHKITTTVLRRRQDWPTIKSTHSLTKNQSQT